MNTKKVKFPLKNLSNPQEHVDARFSGKNKKFTSLLKIFQINLDLKIHKNYFYCQQVFSVTDKKFFKVLEKLVQPPKNLFLTFICKMIKFASAELFLPAGSFLTKKAT
jgi:hypothetical protein